jgi:hypothetical protein
MGICFSHGTANWSYNGFGKYREIIAEGIGVELTLMEGFGGDISWDTVNDDIVPFLNHGDSEGILTHHELKIIIPRLFEIITNYVYLDDYDKSQSIALIHGMVEAVMKEEVFEFR